MSASLSRKYENLENAVSTLERFLKTTRPDELQRAGIIQAFEFCFESFWKLFKFISEHRGQEGGSPKTAIRSAFQQHLIENDAVWLRMLHHRNESVHVYHESVAQEIYTAIRDSYAREFRERLNAIRMTLTSL